MRIDNWYWYFKGALSRKFCEELIHYGQQQEEMWPKCGQMIP